LPAKRLLDGAVILRTPSLASQLLRGPCDGVKSVGAGLPANRPSDEAVILRAPSLASQLLPGVV